MLVPKARGSSPMSPTGRRHLSALPRAIVAAAAPGYTQLRSVVSPGLLSLPETGKQLVLAELQLC